ncbi:sulfatase [Wenzhouxiangella sediminis]|uniref:Sulfatase N-terminal domain-containing protein n=1 Tax=Wenzhouxiangella sediminis TaxID=1792836 RepID=A0A3E1KAD8_9GAMM|nr:sulfatase [Wenzhouxiangella sediminis]RFF31260.1 hypothetical protein DZC52_05440 [Wenzhouxiangella sediminis]
MQHGSIRFFALTALLGLLVSTTGCKQEPERWNVLLVTFDTTRADRIGCYGNDRINTPTLDGLAAEGVRFANAVSVAPITAPSHSSILTGLYPTAHGFRDNGLFVLEGRNRTLAEILKDEGYATAAAVGAFPVVSRFGFDQGFDLFDDHLTGMFEDYQGERAVPKEELFFDERRAAQVNEAVIPWLQQQGDSPFFLWVHYFDPHQPFEPPPPYDQLYADDLYNGEIAYADSRLGHLIEQLRQMGELERTLIVMTADHGEGLGEHNEITHAVLAYDSTLHVPLIVRPPGDATGRVSRVIDERVGTVDIVPTVLDVLGLDVPAELHGQSLASLWRDVVEEDKPEVAYEPRYYAENLSPRLTHGWGELRVLYEGDMKYIHGPRPELYDLSVDPHELENLVADRSEQAREMRGNLATFIREHAASEPTQTQALDPELVQRLQSLGYLHGSGEGGLEVREELQDDGVPPHERVSDINRMSAAKHLLFQGRPAEALNYTEALIEGGSESPLYRELHAAALAGTGRIDEAWEMVTDTRSGNVGSESLVLTLAVERFQQGDREAAIAFLREFSDRRESARASWLLADLFKVVGQDGEALKALERALDFDPEFVPARVDKAVHWARLGEFEKADAAFVRALRDGPYYAKGSYNYGAFLFESGRLMEAEEYFERARELAPRYLKAHFALVAVHHARHDRVGAEAALAALQRIAPDSSEATAAAQLLAGD